MDPHMTREDAAVYLANGPHRRLYQSLTPPRPQPVKKKKLVNFKLSLKGRLGSDRKDDDRGTSTRERRGTFRSSDKRRGTLKNADERREAFASFSDSTDIRFFDARDIMSFDEMRDDVRNFNEREGMQNYNGKKEDIRSFNGRRNDIGQSGNTRYDNERRDEFKNNNDLRSAGSLSDRREDLRNGNQRQEGIRSLNDTGDFRNARQKREAFKNIKERREDLKKNIRERRENLKSAKEKSETAANMNERSETATNMNERSEVSRNFNKIEIVRSVSSSSKDTQLTAEFPGSILNHRERSASSNSRAISREHIPLITMRRKYTSSWEKLRMVAGTNGMGERLNNVVEIVTLKKRKGALAPTIWTPAVPRSVPNPRPANFQNQEEPGKRSYVMAFISKATQSRLRVPRRQYTLPFKQPQRHHEWEARGKMYVNWLKGVVSNPHLQDGLIMKGLEIGVPYPVLYMREKLPDTLSGRDGDRRILEGSLGTDYVIHQGVYQEVVSWIPELLVTCPIDPSKRARCYIIVGFKTLDGELNKKMETLWKEWTGALYIYCNIDDDLGLKRLTFYKRSSRQHATLFSYLLLVELDTVTQENSLFLLDFTYRMRMRNMTGYISVYQEHFPDGAVDVVPGGSPVPSTAQATAAAAASGALLETNSLDLTRINI